MKAATYFADILTDLKLMELAGDVQDFAKLSIALTFNYWQDVIPLKRSNDDARDVTYFILEVSHLQSCTR